MTQLDSSCSSRKRDWPLCSAVGFVGLVPPVYHLAGYLTAEKEGEKVRTVTEPAWQKGPSNRQSRVSEWQGRVKKSLGGFKRENAAVP